VRPRDRSVPDGHDESAEVTAVTQAGPDAPAGNGELVA